MTQRIAVTNQKGGVGKTTTAVNLAACLAAAHKKTLLVDLDPQGNASSGLGADRQNLSRSVYHLLVEDEGDPRQAVLPTALDDLSLLPADIHLVGAEMELIDLPDRSARLSRALEPLIGDYEYILIDCPPSLGLLTVNALHFARRVLIPVQSEYYALEGLSALVQTIRRLRDAINPDLEILGLVLTMYDGRTNLAQQVQEEVRRVFGDQVFRTVIHRSVKFSEASSFGKPILFYDFRSKGAQSYIELCQEVVHVCQKARAGQGT